MDYPLPQTKSSGRLTSQTRTVIMNVRCYFRQQNEWECEEDIDFRACSATGVSKSSIARIKQQHKHGGIKSPPPRSRMSTVLGTSGDFDRDCARQEVLSFYERGEVPTIETLMKKLKEPPVNFSGGRSSLVKLVKELGFCFKKVIGGGYVLLERNDIIAMRSKYFRVIEENRNSIIPRPEIYLDETWVNPNDYVNKSTVPQCSVDPKLKLKKRERFIIVHAWGDEGFVCGGLLVFRSKTGNKEDYSDSMNQECFLSWFQTQLMPNIPSRSLIMLNNSSCNSKVLNKMPTNNCKKCEIIHWLNDHSINHEPSHTKPELLHLVKSHKHLEVCEVDKIARDAGHEVLRLPAYHCYLNPVTLIWAKVKNYMKEKALNHQQITEKFEEITKESFSKISAEDWRACMCHSRKVEEEFRRKDQAYEQFIESVTTFPDDSDNSDDDE